MTQGQRTIIVGIIALTIGQAFRYLTRNLRAPTYREIRDSGDITLAWRSTFLSIRYVSWIGLLAIIMGLAILAQEGT